MHVFDIDEEMVVALKEHHKTIKVNKLKCSKDYDNRDLIFCRFDGNCSNF